MNTVAECDIDRKTLMKLNKKDRLNYYKTVRFLKSLKNLVKELREVAL